MSYFLPPRTDDQRAAEMQMASGSGMSPDAATDMPLATGPTPTRAERRGAAFTLDRATRDSWQTARSHEAAVQSLLIERLGPDFAPGPAPAVQTTPFENRVDFILQRAREAKAAQPDVYADLPTTLDEFDAMVLARRQREVQEAQDIIDRGNGWFPELLGGALAGVTTPQALALLPFGAGGASIARTAASEFALGAADEALSLPAQFQTARDLGLPDPNALQQVAIAGATAGVLGGAIAAAPQALTYGARQWQRIKGQPDAPATAMEFEETVAAETARLQSDAPSQTMGRTNAAPGGTPPEPMPAFPPVTPDAPADWQAIRGGIFAGESNGDYNALYEFSNRPGGPFADVRLTDMTVDQAIAFSAPDGAYGKWVKGKIGRVATPMGAYQIVGTTLREAKQGLGLTGNEVMTPELQERLGQWIYRQQGTGAWEGYRGPRADFTPGAQAANFTPYRTSRPFTGAGQVVVGDDLRIDVTYEVVDLDSLRQASGDLQPRDRGRAASDAWVADTAARLDPALLMPSPTADRGAPIVGPDNIIESGNGRVRAITRAYDLAPDRADAYRQQIASLTGQPIPDTIRRPVLIARRTTDIDAATRRRMVVDAQDSGVARMNATERAQVGRRALSSDLLSQFQPGRKLTGAENRDFARDFAGSFPRSERNAFFDADGGLSIDGVRQIQDAMFARAWDAPDILARYVETEAGELKSLLNAMADAAPHMALLRAEIDAGRIAPEFDITPHVMEAARLIMEAREIAARDGGQVAQLLDDLLADIDLLDGALSPLTVALVKFMAPGGRAASPDKIAGFLARYSAEARKVGAADGGMFGTPTPLDVLQSVDPAAFKDLTELGNVRGQRDSAPARIDPITEGLFTDGAASPDAIATDDALADQMRAAVTRQDAARARIDAITAEAAPSGNDDWLRDLPADVQSAARAARTEAEQLADTLADLKFEDGNIDLNIRDILDDLDRDDALATVIDLCANRSARP